MDIINKDLESIKDKLVSQNVIIGNSTEVIKQILTMLSKLEKEVLKIKEDVKNLKEVKI